MYNIWIGAYIVDEGVKGIGIPGVESFGLCQRLSLVPIPGADENYIYTVGSSYGCVYIKDICFANKNQQSIYDLGHTIQIADYDDESMGFIENYYIRFVLDPVSRWETEDNQTFAELLISDPITFNPPVYSGFYGFYIEKVPVE